MIPRLIRSFFMRVLRLPLIAFWGRWIGPIPSWIPLRKPMAVVFGAPIACPKLAEPTQQQVDAVHLEYMNAIKRIFNEYKGRYGYADDEVLVCKTPERD